MAIETLRTNGKPNGKYRANVKGVKGQTRTTRAEARQDEARMLLEAGRTPDAGQGVSVQTVLVTHMNKAGYAPVTRDLYARMIRNLPETVKQADCRSITTPQLARLLDAMPNQEYARKTKNLLSAAYKRAIRSGWCEQNPARGLSMKQTKANEVVPPSVEDVRLLAKLADDVNPSLGTFIRLAAHLGIRRSEMLGLQWTDITDAPAVKVRRSVTEDARGVRHIGETKTGAKAHRTLAISQDAYDGLLTLPRKGPWLFHHDGTPWRGHYVTLAFSRLSDDYTLHSLRHFVATQMFANGFSVIDVAHRLGDSPVTVLKTYAHFVPDRDRSAAEILPY